MPVSVAVQPFADERIATVQWDGQITRFETAPPALEPPDAARVGGAGAGAGASADDEADGVALKDDPWALAATNADPRAGAAFQDARARLFAARAQIEQLREVLRLSRGAGRKQVALPGRKLR